MKTNTNRERQRAARAIANYNKQVRAEHAKLVDDPERFETVVPGRNEKTDFYSRRRTL